MAAFFEGFIWSYRLVKLSDFLTTPLVQDSGSIILPESYLYIALLRHLYLHYVLQTA